MADIIPFPAGRIQGARAPTISRQGGTFSGSLHSWNPRRTSYREEGRQRELLSHRANDLAGNDAHGASLIDAITTNTVGPGLWPQAKPNYKRLGLSEEQANTIAEQAEWEFEQFNRQADARGVIDFYGLQFQNLWSMLVNGEFINLPLMLRQTDRRYRLALQAIDPLRLRTPLSLEGDPNIRDGIRLGKLGEPRLYYIANPPGGGMGGLGQTLWQDYVGLPPKRGHRSVVIHRYHAKAPEQVRGVTVLAPAMQFFRNFADYMDYELLGAILAASFSVFMEKQTPYDINAMPGVSTETQADGSNQTYQEVPPGQIMYGNPGEKPHLLKSERPGNSFDSFVNTAIRGVGAAAGMPYEVISKDFSQTNYSSARAALQEAWRVFELYQDWLISGFCQPVWEMFFEEAILGGRIQLPAGAPNFYAHKAEYCRAQWVGPERTNVDPVKEMTADIMGLNANVTTLADIAAKRNKDWEDQVKQRSRERTTCGDLNLREDPLTPTEAKNSQGRNQEDT